MAKFYQVLEPFRIYRQKGISLSNTWVGRSQAYNNIYDVLNAKPGDRIHDLPGGTFIEIGDGDGDGRVFTLTAPKHIFEKSYGFVSDSRLLDDMAKSGRVKVIPDPGGNPNYVGWRNASSVDMGPLRQELDVIEASPELQAFRRDILPELEDWIGDGTVTQFDHGERPVVGAVIELEDGKFVLEWLFKPDFYRVRPHGKDVPVAVLQISSVDRRFSREEIIALLPNQPTLPKP